ncbi:uncharacterized protein [Lepeophtheirus salmonis]|uniref:uncharacterized protein n=1 Tax=Lepeophtheirus salmonis TaxID=72036 RepID=UPI001AE3E5AF|nr:uncharacterized protein LOC121128469 [Lepeophtheirus salmonis]
MKALILSINLIILLGPVWSENPKTIIDQKVINEIWQIPYQKFLNLKKEAGTYSCGDCQKKVTDLLIPSQSNKKDPDIKPFILKLFKMIKVVNECIPCLCKAVNRKRGISFEGCESFGF